MTFCAVQGSRVDWANAYAEPWVYEEKLQVAMTKLRLQVLRTSAKRIGLQHLVPSAGAGCLCVDLVIVHVEDVGGSGAEDGRHDCAPRRALSARGIPAAEPAGPGQLVLVLSPPTRAQGQNASSQKHTRV